MKMMGLTKEELNIEIEKAKVAIKQCQFGIDINTIVLKGCEAALKCTSTS